MAWHEDKKGFKWGKNFSTSCQKCAEWKYSVRNWIDRIACHYIRNCRGEFNFRVKMKGLLKIEISDVYWKVCCSVQAIESFGTFWGWYLDILFLEIKLKCTRWNFLKIAFFIFAFWTKSTVG